MDWELGDVAQVEDSTVIVLGVIPKPFTFDDFRITEPGADDSAEFSAGYILVSFLTGPHPIGFVDALNPKSPLLTRRES